ncbi:MAG TPA: FAD-binding oxidoreductase [Solibacterales bacterium]|nr:FAD-binding oxidoreductase [Bryobacterales bacterium]
MYAPASELELRDILRRANENRTPITIAGAGTGVAGGRVPLSGWVVSLEKFRELAVEPGRLRAGAGVPLREVQRAALNAGQFYPPDPTETWASIGGTIATNASGSRSFRYGGTRRYVKALRIMHASGTLREYRRGEAIDFEVPDIPRPNTTKHAVGYDLHPGMDWVDLFIGSEGTLGVVTAAELELLPRPQAPLGGVVFFSGETAAVDAVEQWRGIPRLNLLEYLDAASLQLLRPLYGNIPAGAGAALMIEQEAGDADEWLDRLQGAGAFESSWFAEEGPDLERFREFRHALPRQINAMVASLGAMKWSTDCAVPVARQREMLAFYRERMAVAFAGRCFVFGHIGDAHLHVNLLAPGDEQQRASGLILECARRAVALGGTVSAEHGLGKRKAHLLELQYGVAAIEAMRTVKKRLDPYGALGHGTLFASRIVAEPNDAE